MKDILQEIAATAREVARRGQGDDELIAVRLRREYEADVDDVWQAVTDPERVARWFAPVSGDLREGGTFQVEGNAGGDIQECKAPSLLTLTWGAPASIVRVSLSACGDGTALDLEHTVPAAFAGSGAGALYVGPGWDVALLGLALWLRGDLLGDPTQWEASPEVARANAASIDAWIAVVADSGTATEDQLAEATAAARAQFAPEHAGSPSAS